MSAAGLPPRDVDAASAGLPSRAVDAASAGPPPSDVDVLIVGGGIVGTALAYYLAREGVDVALLERGELNREASGTNAGSMHLQIAIHQLTGADTGGARERLLDEVRDAVAAAELWRGLEAELDGSLELHVTGGWMVAETPEQVRLLHEKQRLEEAGGLPTEVVEGDELRARAPYLADDIPAAAWCPSEGHANPLVAVPLLARRAAGHGAAIRTHCAVEAIEPRADGGFDVRTAHGAIRARRVVNAAGAWSQEVAAMVGARLPLRADGLHVNVTEPREHVLGPLVQHIGRRLTLKQSHHGTFLIGGGWPARPEPPPARFTTRWDSAAGNAAVALRVVPLLADVRLLRTWSGVMAFTDDLAPVVGELRAVPGYHACVVTTGFTLGPLMARRLAESMTGAASPIPTAHLPDRQEAP